MCFLRKKKQKTENNYGDYTLLAFGINAYRISPLYGCLNDVDDVADKFKAVCPNLDIYKFKDRQVRKRTFREELVKAIAALPEGGTVAVITDCCYSGSNTRSIVGNKARMVNLGAPRGAVTIKKVARMHGMKWISISGCGEGQTSADALINNRFNGAFTFYALRSLKRGMTYNEWMGAIGRYLPSDNFAQNPEIEGKKELLDSVIFDRPTLIVWYSGHGTYVKDKSGDEVDGYDEALYLYDGVFLDDDLFDILNRIK